MNWIIDARIVLACFFGGLVGAKIALFFSIPYGLGIAAGAVLGWMLWDPMRLLRAVKRAAQETFTWAPTFFLLWFWVAIGAASFITAIFGSVIFPANLGRNISIDWEVLGAIVACITVLGATVIAYGETQKIRTGADASTWPDLREARARTVRRRVVRYWNPIAWSFWILYGTVRSLIWLVRRCGQYVGQVVANRSETAHFVGHTLPRSIGAFFYRIVTYYHTRESRVCLVDSGIGAAVGIYLGDPLWGGIIGALVGVLNYEIISVRVLKVAESKIRF